MRAGATQQPHHTPLHPTPPPLAPPRNNNPAESRVHNKALHGATHELRTQTHTHTPTRTHTRTHRQNPGLWLQHTASKTGRGGARRGGSGRSAAASLLNRNKELHMILSIRNTKQCFVSYKGSFFVLRRICSRISFVLQTKIYCRAANCQMARRRRMSQF